MAAEIDLSGVVSFYNKSKIEALKLPEQ